MKKSYVIAGSLAAVAGLWIVSGLILPGIDDKADMVTGEFVEPELPRVRVREMTAEMRDNQISLLGRTEAERRVDIRAQTKGAVIAIVTEEGKTVSDSAEILKIDLEDRDARLEQMKATEQQYRMAYEAARKLAKNSYRSKVTLAANRADWEKAKAELVGIKQDIDHTIIKAPFEGIIDDVRVEKGDFVEVGDVVATVVDLDPIVIVGEITERDVINIIPGGKAVVKFTNGQKLDGVVDYISKVGGVSTRTFRVEVKVPNPDQRLFEGLTVELNIPVGTAPAYLVSPAVLTLSDKGDVGIKAVNVKNQVVFYPIKIIGDTPEGIWLGGLPGQLTLITVGQEFVRVGDAVVPVDEEEIKKASKAIAKAMSDREQ